MGRRPTALVLILPLTLLAACVPQPLAVTREPVNLRLAGSTTSAHIAETLAGAYEASHPWVNVAVIEDLNDRLVKDRLHTGSTDLALLAGLGEETAGADLWSAPIAQDGIAVIAHPTTPITETGIAFLQEIFRGRVQEWNGAVLNVVSREEGSGIRASFERLVLGERETTLTAVVMPSDEAIIEYIVQTPNTIGYVSTLSLGDEDSVRVLPVEGIRPTGESVRDGTYPLLRQLHLASAGEPTDGARTFAQWALGREGAAVIRELSAR